MLCIRPSVKLGATRVGVYDTTRLRLKQACLIVKIKHSGKCGDYVLQNNT